MPLEAQDAFVLRLPVDDSVAGVAGCHGRL